MRLHDLDVRYRAPTNQARYSRPPDFELKRITGGDIGVLDAATALKYIAYRLKDLDNEKKPDLMTLKVLSSVFHKVEKVLGKTPYQSAGPKLSSTTIGMHNQCNIWELSESKEKTCCFFMAYSDGLRDQRDIDYLIESMHVWSVTGFDGSEPNIFSRLAGKIRELAGESFPKEDLDLEERFRNEAEHHARRIEEVTLASKCRVSRMDYLLSQHPKHERPTRAFLMELLDDVDRDSFFDYCEHLMDEVGYRVDGITAKEVYVAMEDLSRLAWGRKAIGSNTGSLQTVARHAIDSWENNNHEDVVYYDWDHEGSCDRGHRREESIYGDSDESSASGAFSKAPPHDDCDDGSELEMGTDMESVRDDNGRAILDLAEADPVAQDMDDICISSHSHSEIASEESKSPVSFSFDSRRAIAPLTVSHEYISQSTLRTRSVPPGRGKSERAATSTPQASTFNLTGDATARDTSRRILQCKSIKARSQSCTAPESSISKHSSDREQEAHQFSSDRLRELLAELEHGSNIMKLDLQQTSIRPTVLVDQSDDTASCAATACEAPSSKEGFRLAELVTAIPTTLPLKSSPLNDFQTHGSDSNEAWPDDLVFKFAADPQRARLTFIPTSSPHNDLSELSNQDRVLQSTLCSINGHGYERRRSDSLLDEFETATCNSFGASNSDGGGSSEVTGYVGLTQTLPNPTIEHANPSAKQPDSIDDLRRKITVSDPGSELDDNLRSPNFVLAVENSDSETVQSREQNEVEPTRTQAEDVELFRTRVKADHSLPEELSPELSDSSSEDGTSFEPANSSVGSQLPGKISTLIKTLGENCEIFLGVRKRILGEIPASSDTKEGLGASRGDEPTIDENEDGAECRLTARTGALIANLRTLESEWPFGSSDSQEPDQQE